MEKNKQKLITKEKTHNLLTNCYMISFKRENSTFLLPFASATSFAHHAAHALFHVMCQLWVYDRHDIGGYRAGHAN